MHLDKRLTLRRDCLLACHGDICCADQTTQRQCDPSQSELDILLVNTTQNVSPRPWTFASYYNIRDEPCEKMTKSMFGTNICRTSWASRWCNYLWYEPLGLWNIGLYFTISIAIPLRWKTELNPVIDPFCLGPYQNGLFIEPHSVNGHNVITSYNNVTAKECIYMYLFIRQSGLSLWRSIVYAMYWAVCVLGVHHNSVSLGSPQPPLQYKYVNLLSQVPHIIIITLIGPHVVRGSILSDKVIIFVIY